MPCTDVTEVLRLTFDEADRLTGYELSKRTCGRAVGEKSLIAAWACGRAAGELLDADIDAFLAAHPTPDETEEFLLLKHFFALRSGLAVYLGFEPGGPGDACAIASIGHGPGDTEFVGELKVEILTEQIRSCGKCGKACGVRQVKA